MGSGAHWGPTAWPIVSGCRSGHDKPGSAGWCVIHAGKSRPESGQEAEWHSGNHTRKGKEERKRKKEKRGREGREERKNANRRKLWTCRAVSASRRLHLLSDPRTVQSGGWGRLDLGRRVVAFQSTTAKNKRSAKGSKTPREKALRQGPEANEPAPGREEWQSHRAQRGIHPRPPWGPALAGQEAGVPRRKGPWSAVAQRRQKRQKAKKERHGENGWGELNVQCSSDGTVPRECPPEALGEGPTGLAS